MTTTADAARGTTTFWHEALFYGDPDAFLSSTADFVRAGLEAGEPTMVVLSAAKLAVLRSELGAEADAVIMADMELVGANPARIIPAWRHFLDEYGVGDRPVRGLGEPIWAARSADELVECQLHEALLNVAFAEDGGFRLLCPYDLATLDAPVLEEARRTHAFVDPGYPARPCVEFGGASAFLELLEAPLPEPTAPVEVHRFDRGTLAGVRRRVFAIMMAAGLERRAKDVCLAVHEAAANSVRHGGGRGRWRTWCQGGSLVFEVTNPGRITDPLIGRVAPPLESPSGRGVWLMNQVCDLVQVRNAPEGVLVRLHVRP